MQKLESKKHKPIKAWVDGVPVEYDVWNKAREIAALPIIADAGIAIMPDVHQGIGAMVGSVIPTVQAIIPAAVGVDIGCGMCARRTNLTANDLPDSLLGVRIAIEAAVPHGGPGVKGSWNEQGYTRPKIVSEQWMQLDNSYKEIVEINPEIMAGAHAGVNQLGTLGGGNHFIEICLDKEDRVWIMLHSGSRGVGNRIGSFFIAAAKEDMIKHNQRTPTDTNLSYLSAGSDMFENYIVAVDWAQKYAAANRAAMLHCVTEAVEKELGRKIEFDDLAVNCHHNYVNYEKHGNQWMYVTRKGAVSAKKDQLGIIPGSMGAKSYIVRGKGNSDSYHSCSHGAGRTMSRRRAKEEFTVEDHVKATAGVECRKDISVIDETPGAYKSIEAVMAAQTDLVDIVYELHQVVCVKG